MDAAVDWGAFVVFGGLVAREVGVTTLAIIGRTVAKPATENTLSCQASVKIDKGTRPFMVYYFGTVVNGPSQQQQLLVVDVRGRRPTDFQLSPCRAKRKCDRVQYFFTALFLVAPLRYLLVAVIDC